MMGYPEIAVIILNWNGMRHWPDCMAALAAQTYPNVRVIVPDNGSTDESLAWLRENWPDVEIVENGWNMGFAAGNNRGIEACDSPYVALLNNDTAVVPNWCELLVNTLENDATLGSAASLMVLFDDPEIVDSAGDGMSVCGVPYKRGRGEKTADWMQPGPVWGACGGAVMYRRAMLEDVGLLDEDFFIIYEDGDLAFRARLAGWGCAYVPQATVRHKVNATLGTLSRTHVYYGQRNAEWLYRKNMPDELLPKTRWAHFWYVVIGGIYFFCKGKGKFFLEGRREARKGNEKLLEKRKTVQAKMRVDVNELWAMMDKKWLRRRLKR